ncbi:Sulfur carrier protein ThiS adenylyltransferase [Thalassoglobus neptunius]|uniref:Sulfur carrier protein ThiS adenylyltransferase n=1 Tax=Thalassoglobus neptunius TaxID=1938619 RepID=A0A5C5VRP1_9PLAN|nr:ThiF family adenylyltransferase [Thalassoglobus neptunius]TWT40860.1 Sulfur carrier protein ThiS adenylyltransferase [Thalassoglobus neptunius]
MSASSVMEMEQTHEVIIPRATWETALRRLLVSPGRWATGRIRTHKTADSMEWLVDQLELAEEFPDGRTRLSRANWIVVGMLTDDERSPEEILNRMLLQATQQVVVLLFHQTERGRWSGIVHRNGTLFPMDGVRVIGSGMLHLQRNPVAIPDVPDDGRWSRTIGGLAPSLWQRTRSAHVLLIGCGRNGTMAAWQLAGLGVHRLTLVDPDKLAIENIEAMPGLEFNDIGKPKTAILGQQLLKQNPDLMLRCFAYPVSDILDRLKARYDLIVTCVDDDVPRLGASWLARELLIPHIDVGSSVQRSETGETTLAGDVRMLLPHEGCIQCVGGLADREQTMYEFAAPPGSLHRGVPVEWNQQRAGSLVHLNSMTVGIGVELWLRLLRGEIGSYWQRLTVRSRAEFELTGAAVGAGEQCEFCRDVQVVE